MGQTRAVPPRKASYQAPSAHRLLEESACLRQLGSVATQLAAAKVSEPEFCGNMRKFWRDFKGLFPIRNVQVRILPGQPASSGFVQVSLRERKRPANSGLSRTRRQSPPSHLTLLTLQIAESLRLGPRIFGRYRRRSRPLMTYWRR